MKKVMIKILLMTIAFLVNSFSFSVADVQANLWRAAIDGNIAMAQEALNLGADVNKQNRIKRTALMFAGIQGNVPMIKFLLNAGANIDAAPRTGRTALSFAAGDNHLPAVALLLEYGANPDIATKLSKVTPLMKVADEGYAPIAALLLANGADMYLKNSEGQTALDIAKKKGNVAVVKVIEDFIAKRRKEVSEEILKTRPETYPAITEEIAEFEIGK
ncbi:MAG: ankyrin repeat domain-containing protein [Candidatus Babeliales bacterium]